MRAARRACCWPRRPLCRRGLPRPKRPEPPPIVVTGERLERAPSTREALDAARIDETVNVVNVEDALRYLPSLLVRKRQSATPRRRSRPAPRASAPARAA